MFGDLYSMEADNDEIDVCMKSQVNNETAVTEAGTDTKAEDVSKIDTKTEAHNEQASTGGVATGSDSSDMEMDPVAATEAFCFKAFSMSAEDLANEVEDNIKVANAIPDADDAEAAADTSDPELEAVGMNNAGVSTDDPAKVIPDETPADTAGITPDADESKDDGEEDADAPTNPIPPALPTSEEDWEFSLEGMPIYSLESLEKYRKMVEVSSVDEYFKDPSVKANLDKLIITLKNKKWNSLTKSGIKDLKKALFSKGIPNSEKIKTAKEKGINISVSDYKYKTLNTIIERCKIDNSDVATVVVCYDVGGKYKVHYFGDMMFVKKSKEDLEYEESEENFEFSEEQMETIRAEVARSLEAEYSTEENKVISKAEGFNLGYKAGLIGNYIQTLVRGFKLAKVLGANAPLLLAKSLGKNAVYTSANCVLTTAIGSLISCGTFEDGTDVLKSPKCQSKILAFKNNHKNNTLTANELKKIPEARSKSGFLKWIFLEQASGKKINDLDKVDVAIREVEGVPVSIVKLTPFTGSMDLKQLAGYRIIIVTGYYKDGKGTVHSKHLCQAYITKGAKVNKSGESLSRESAPYTDFI